MTSIRLTLSVIINNLKLFSPLKRKEREDSGADCARDRDVRVGNCACGLYIYKHT
jgi:hypothetical protein